MRFLLFIIPVLLGVLGAHYALYVTVRSAFGVEGMGARLALYLVPLFLTLSLIFSHILVEVSRNVLTVAYAVLSSVWLGLFVNLLMAVGGIWLVYLGGKIVGRVPDMRVVCYVGLGLAVLLTVFSMWNARKPRITRVTVPVQGLPEVWRGKRVVQLSDVHLGTILGKGYARGVVERVNALEPDLVLITGDLFDGMGGPLEEYVKVLDGLEARKGVFFVTGNHEGYVGLGESLEALRGGRMRVLENEVVEVEGLQIVGLGFPEHGGGELSIDGEIDRSRPSILMYHTPSEVVGAASDRGAQQSRTYFSADAGFSFVREHSIDLQLSGHTHAGQFFPFTVVNRIIFGRHNYGLHRVDDFHVYTTSGTGTWGPPVRLGSRSEIVEITLE